MRSGECGVKTEKPDPEDSPDLNSPKGSDVSVGQDASLSQYTVTLCTKKNTAGQAGRGTNVEKSAVLTPHSALRTPHSAMISAGCVILPVTALAAATAGLDR